MRLSLDFDTETTGIICKRVCGFIRPAVRPSGYWYYPVVCVSFKRPLKEFKHLHCVVVVRVLGWLMMAAAAVCCFCQR